jgi:hypothetical protein
LELDIERLWQFKLSGYCCSQMIIAMGLEAKGEDNPTLIQAISGLCNGLYSGLLCGALSGAACFLSMWDSERAAEIMIPELTEWFQEAYGTVNCEQILENDPMAKIEKCPNIVIETYKKALELLEENHCSIEGDASW